MLLLFFVADLLTFLFPKLNILDWTLFSKLCICIIVNIKYHIFFSSTLLHKSLEQLQRCNNNGHQVKVSLPITAKTNVSGHIQGWINEMFFCDLGEIWFPIWCLWRVNKVCKTPVNVVSRLFVNTTKKTTTFVSSWQSKKIEVQNITICKSNMNTVEYKQGWSCFWKRPSESSNL